MSDKWTFIETKRAAGSSVDFEIPIECSEVKINILSVVGPKPRLGWIKWWWLREKLVWWICKEKNCGEIMMRLGAYPYTSSDGYKYSQGDEDE